MLFWGYSKINRTVDHFNDSYIFTKAINTLKDYLTSSVQGVWTPFTLPTLLYLGFCRIFISGFSEPLPTGLHIVYKLYEGT